MTGVDDAGRMAVAVAITRKPGASGTRAACVYTRHQGWSRVHVRHTYAHATGLCALGL